MEGLRVVCPNCKRRDFVTTEKFDAEKQLNGAMVRCLLPYQIDWLCSSTTHSAEMTCPECCAMLAPQGRLTVVEDESRAAKKIEAATKARQKGGVKGNVKCPVCGKVLKTEFALKGHMQSHRRS